MFSGDEAHHAKRSRVQLGTPVRPCLPNVPPPMQHHQNSYTPDEVDQILRTMNQHYHQQLEFYYTAMREIVAGTLAENRTHVPDYIT